MDHLEKLKELENCMVTKAENKVKISFSRQQINPAEILLKVMKEGYHVKDFTVLETSLEDAIRTIYRNAKKGNR
jgi:ABC-type uncharacterized transport system ATPase subunit